MEQDDAYDTGGSNNPTSDAMMEDDHSTDVEQQRHAENDNRHSNNNGQEDFDGADCSDLMTKKMEEQPSIKEEDERLLASENDDDYSNYSESECDFDDDDDDEEEEEEEDIYKPEDYEKEDESMSAIFPETHVDSYYHHPAHHEQWKVEAWWRATFRRYLVHLDRNDETLDYLYEWIGELHYPWIWTNDNLTALGESLIGNTHLEALSVSVSAKQTLDFQDNNDNEDNNNNNNNNNTFSLIPGITVLHRGIAQSQLKALILIGVYGPLQRTLLEQAKIILPLGPLALTQLWDMTMIQPNVMRMAFDVSLSSPSSPLSTPTPRPLSQPQLWSHVTQLHLTDGAWEESDMTMLCFCLAKHPWLEILEMSNNQITFVGVDIFCRFWNYDSALRMVKLSDNLISAKGAQQLMQAATLRPACKNLVLKGNTNIGYAGLQLVGEELASSFHLKYLNMVGCVPSASSSNSEASDSTDAQDAACRALASGLRGNTSLINLCIGENMLGDLGAQVLMQAAVVHPTLQIFSLAGDTSIGFQGIKYMAEELASPASRIKLLGLEGVLPLHWACGNAPTPVTPLKLELEARAALLRAVQNNIHLTKLRADMMISPTQSKLGDFEFFLGVNESFRPLLASDVMPSTAWPLALAHTIPSYIYFVLQQRPCLVVTNANE